MILMKGNMVRVVVRFIIRFLVIVFFIKVMNNFSVESGGIRKLIVLFWILDIRSDEEELVNVLLSMFIRIKFGVRKMGKFILLIVGWFDLIVIMKIVMNNRVVVIGVIMV